MSALRIFIIMVIIGSCLAFGCTETTSVVGTENGGITERTVFYHDDTATFEEALRELHIQNARGYLDTEDISIYQINGADVNISAEAKSWIFGITRYNSSSLLIFNPINGWREEEWSLAFPEEEIKIDEILGPTDLYGKNRALIEQTMNFHNTSRTDLELSGGIYTIYVRTSTNISTLSFHADNGELIE